MIAIRSVTRRLAVIVYLAVVLAPVVLLGYDGPWLGPGDIAIRGRAPFPAKLTPGSFKDFDTWFADRVGLRYPLIWAGAGLHVGLLQRPLDRHIFFGRDGWMFWTDDAETIPATMADSRGKLRFTEPEVGRIDRQMRAVRDRFEACGIPVYVVVVPNKETIYGQYLFRADAKAPATRLETLLNELSEPARSIFLDLRPSMRAAAAAHTPETLYPKTETHWNELGAFYGYAAIMAALAKRIPIAHPELTSLDRYMVESSPYPGGDMAVRVLFSPWRFRDEYVTVRPKVPIVERRQMQLAHDHTLIRNPRGEGRLVLFGDSFAHALMPFLGQHFAEVHRYTAETIDGAVAARHAPSAVILQMVERHGERLLHRPVNLSRLCGKR